jgi:chromosomal replication initiation ATPase DnaA
MALRGRMSALKLINRIKQHEMETIGIKLAASRVAEKKIEAQSVQLRNDALREAALSTEEARIFLPAYLKSVEARQHELAEELTIATHKTGCAEEELFKSFREAKTTQQVIGSVAKELALEAARAMTAEMDDASRSLFLLKRNEQTGA